jgi:hypothetical protein
MPVVHCGDGVCTSSLGDFELAIGEIRFKVRLATMGLPGVGIATFDLRGFFADCMANFMVLAPARNANRAMALNERWSERLMVAIGGCLAYSACPDTH